MKQKTINIPRNLYKGIVQLASKKSMDTQEALDYSIRLANSVADSEEQLPKKIASFFVNTRGLSTELRREMAYIIRNLYRLNRSLWIMTEMQREDIREYKYMIHRKSH